MQVDILGVGSALRRARTERGLSQQELSRRLGLTQNTLSRVETGANARIDTISEIAHALDLELLLVARRLVPVVEAIVSERGAHRSGRYNEALEDEEP